MENECGLFTRIDIGFFCVQQEIIQSKDDSSITSNIEINWKFHLTGFEIFFCCEMCQTYSVAHEKKINK